MPSASVAYRVRQLSKEERVGSADEEHYCAASRGTASASGSPGSRSPISTSARRPASVNNAIDVFGASNENQPASRFARSGAGVRDRVYAEEVDALELAQVEHDQPCHAPSSRNVALPGLGKNRGRQVVRPATSGVPHGGASQGPKPYREHQHCALPSANVGWRACGTGPMGEDERRA